MTKQTIKTSPTVFMALKFSLARSLLSLEFPFSFFIILYCSLAVLKMKTDGVT